MSVPNVPQPQGGGPPPPHIGTDFDALRQALETENNNIDIQNQTIQNSNQQLQQAISDLGVSHKTMNENLSGLLHQMDQEIQGQEHLVRDVSGMAKSNQGAAEALSQIESNRTELKQKMVATSAKLEQVTKSLADEEQKGRTLSQVNQQLHALHENQVAKIRTNVELLKQLNQSIQTLTDQAQRLKAETDPKHNIVTMYILYPYLIKIRTIFGDFITKQQSKPAQNSIINVQTVQQLILSFRDLAQLSFQQSLQSVQSVVETLQHVSQTLTNVQKVADDQKRQNLPQQEPESFFLNYQRKIQDVQEFWIQPTNTFYLIATWLRDFCNVQYDPDVQATLNKYNIPVLR